jgi:hypothetical protein
MRSANAALCAPRWASSQRDRSASVRGYPAPPPIARSSVEIRRGRRGGEHLGGQVLGEGTEVVHFPPTRLITGTPAAPPTRLLDAVVARHEARRDVVVTRQRTDARERVDDLRAVHRDVREDLCDEVEEVRDLVVGADGRRRGSASMSVVPTMTRPLSG